MSALRIGVTASRTKEDRSVHRVTDGMAHAVQSAGGAVVTLDFPLNRAELDQILPTLDGLILAGGPDVHPKYFGEEIDPHCGEIDDERDGLEMYLMDWAMKADIPVLGVCRGMQVINIALGGDIYQDIVHPLGLTHRQMDGVRYFHDAIFQGELVLSGLAGSARYPVNSYHHQALRRMADGLTVTAVAPDGVIEAFERPASRFVMGVQWHPESSYDADSLSRKIFAAFLKACRNE